MKQGCTLGRTYNQFHSPRKYDQWKRISTYGFWNYRAEANRNLLELDGRFVTDGSQSRGVAARGGA